ncbi:hypothetical protein EV667_2752 [Ancylobacter aquaticus]|uniref:SH3 domain-containing protein n=1 Tax=Ancylobacter aquaticus TaxID=100 RepID=A0A4R1I5L7_ANCAQ|nr:SH3 domain-containing protein [Ancylobacter aquaticus]TCK28740.1 hypothetical protein EV667_2752 [Ancylobacter aquaticus]
MPTSSQQPRGTGLSSSLISDFRTIVSSLEQEKADRNGGGPGSESPPVARPQAEAEPRSFGDVRSRIAALGDVSGVLGARSAAPKPEPAAASAAESAQAARRRSFGSAARQPGEAETRRKRSASKDVITWQRLGVLAVFMAVVGGGAVALQSLAAREEAKVAPEVIGNAAVASVAPSALPSDTASGPATAVAAVEVEPAAPSPAASSALVNAMPGNSLPPLLRNATEPLDAAGGSLPVTAFAATPADAGPLSGPVVPEAARAEPAMASIELTAAPAESAATPVALPKEIPLPPSRARERQVAALAAPPAEDQPAAPAEAAEEGYMPAGFGGEPIGTAVTRRPVTMRAAPKRGAAAIGTLPAGQKVDLVVCQQWCEIIVEGKRVFVYKSFIDAGGTAGSAAAAEGAGATPEDAAAE